MASRKLNSTVERTLKQIQEGIQLCQELWDKHAQSEGASREKCEADLKREIKKLGRLRDDLKKWEKGHEVKNKKPITEARKTIESEMERFKSSEKQTKMKPYSKESLSTPSRLYADPTKDPKYEALEWLRNTLIRLDELIEIDEEELDTLDEHEHPQIIKELYEHISNHNQHKDTLSEALHNLESDIISKEQVENERDNVEYYLSSYRDILHDDSLTFNFDSIENDDEEEEGDAAGSGGSGGGGDGGDGEDISDKDKDETIIYPRESSKQTSTTLNTDLTDITLSNTVPTTTMSTSKSTTNDTTAASTSTSITPKTTPSSTTTTSSSSKVSKSSESDEVDTSPSKSVWLGVNPIIKQSNPMTAQTQTQTQGTNIGGLLAGTNIKATISSSTPTSSTPASSSVSSNTTSAVPSASTSPTSLSMTLSQLSTNTTSLQPGKNSNITQNNQGISPTKILPHVHSSISRAEQLAHLDLLNSTAASFDEYSYLEDEYNNYESRNSVNSVMSSKSTHPDWLYEPSLSAPSAFFPSHREFNSGFGGLEAVRTNVHTGKLTPSDSLSNQSSNINTNNNNTMDGLDSVIKILYGSCYKETITSPPTISPSLSTSISTSTSTSSSTPSIDLDTLFYIFYYSPGTQQQMAAAYLLRHFGWLVQLSDTTMTWIHQKMEKNSVIPCVSYEIFDPIRWSFVPALPETYIFALDHDQTGFNGEIFYPSIPMTMTAATNTNMNTSIGTNTINTLKTKGSKTCK